MNYKEIVPPNRSFKSRILTGKNLFKNYLIIFVGFKDRLGGGSFVTETFLFDLFFFSV